MGKEPASETTSLVSRQISIEGEVSGAESLHVDGRVKGTIRLAGDLFVGAGGVVEAEVDARNVVIQGTVTGKVLARRQLELRPGGRFSGECTAAAYEIREGASFEGISRMFSTRETGANAPAPAAEPRE
ncbi:MAG TPA: polymer-forming cytoskeletal protein [Desulfobacterales bacterium]|nr:polymer-forming cytoskeletal protein [Desulfobacterales bacterium]